MPALSFNQLALPPALLNNLERLGYEQMTPIQAASLPVILAGKDLIAQAQTGSGKTASFGLGLLARLNPDWFSIQGLILCPTRELAAQVSRELRKLASLMPNIKILSLCGGSPIGPQVASLEYGAHLIVGTPGRVLQHLRQGSLHLQHLQLLVLDEADRMLDMGFESAILELLPYLPASRQSLLFSATYPDSLGVLGDQLLDAPERIVVTPEVAPLAIQQLFYEVPNRLKAEVVAQLLSQHRFESTLVFCNTRNDCQQLTRQLTDYGFSTLELHSELDQKSRDQALLRFANRSQSVLVATDVAARGLDIQGLDAVINYELPTSPEVQVHRIGRTGRAGQSGQAFSLFSPSEAYRIAAIERLQQFKAPLASIGSLPSQIQPFHPPMRCLLIDGGRKSKLRAGDLVGALTGTGGFDAADIGKIDIGDFQSQVAIRRPLAQKALQALSDNPIKGRSFRVRLV